MHRLKMYQTVIVDFELAPFHPEAEELDGIATLDVAQYNSECEVV